MKQMKFFPNTMQEYLKGVASETARMSYPGRMGGLVKENTKTKVVEKYFVYRFPLRDVWDNAEWVARSYDGWHEERMRELSRDLDTENCLKAHTDLPEAIAAKFLNTFMHQLMKYEKCRPLFDTLHLPLDGRTLRALWSRRREYSALNRVENIIADVKDHPYHLTYTRYMKVQDALLTLISDLNARPIKEFEMRSRIELNILWAE